VSAPLGYRLVSERKKAAPGGGFLTDAALSLSPSLQLSLSRSIALSGHAT